jgi:hypothetical protein
MTQRKRTKEIGELIKKSDDPAAILGQIYRRFDLPEDDGPRPAKRRSTARRRCVEVQVDDLGLQCECAVSNWLFGPGPEARERLGPLSVSGFVGLEVSDDGRFPKGGIDDGTFPSDPILMGLRRRLRDSLTPPLVSRE